MADLTMMSTNVMDGNVGARVRSIVHTHRHLDHVGGRVAFKQMRTTHVILSPMKFIGRLVALAWPRPKPRINLARLHRFCSPNSKLRKQIVPEKSIPAGARLIVSMSR